MAGGADNCTAETFFETSYSLPGVGGWGAFRGNAAEVIKTTAAFDGVVDGAPLKRIGGHEIAVFIAGSAMKISSDFSEKSNHDAGYYFVFVIGVVDINIVFCALSLDDMLVMRKGVRAKMVTVAGF